MNSLPFISHHLYVAAVVQEDALQHVAQDREAQGSPGSDEGRLSHPPQGGASQAETDNVLKGLTKLIKLTG